MKKRDRQTASPREYVYSPADIARIGVQSAQQSVTQYYRAVPFFIPVLNEYIRPIPPTKLCLLIAQTHNGKSMMLEQWEQHLARYLIDANRENEVIVHVDVENVIDEQAEAALGREGAPINADIQDWNTVKGRFINASLAVSRIPIYRIGVRAGSGDFSKLHMSNVVKLLRYIEGNDADFRMSDRRLQIAAVFFDYLQAFPRDPSVSRLVHKDQRRLEVRENIFAMRRIASLVNAAAICAVQAKQELTGNPGSNMLLPGMYDGVETMDIATRADFILSQWMPKVNFQLGSTVTHNNTSFIVNEQLIWFRCLKQRVMGGAPSGSTWPLYIDYDSMQIRPALVRGGMVVNPFINP